MITATDFFKALYCGCEAGYLELRPLPMNQHRAFIPIRDILLYTGSEHPAIADYLSASHQQRFNAYFGVAPRLTPGDGSAANVRWLSAFFVDFDFKLAGLAGQCAVEERISKHSKPPSMTVRSGGGIHGYFLLNAPADAAVAAPTLRRWAEQFAGYADIKCSEPARVLRVPGSYNYKPDYVVPPMVTVDVFEPDRRYHVQELMLLPTVDKSRYSSNQAPDYIPTGREGQEHISKADLIWRLPDVIEEGGDLGRNNTLQRLACRLYWLGMNQREVLRIINYINAQRCKPALPHTEVLALVRSSEKYEAPGAEDLDPGVEP